jgi:D-cysteine desulfhydrase family pyridoxal phosphate-dependent enzyme
MTAASVTDADALDRRVRLAALPTPLEPADRLAAALDMDAGALWIKRDDLTGLAGGGNKVRKLEYLCAEAVGLGADTLVTGAGVQSNHCRMTAAAANKLGMACTLVLSGTRPEHPSGNVLLDRLLGATVHWLDGTTSLGDELDQAIELAGEQLQESGRRPYVIPVGGSNAIGGLGYVRAADELVDQLPDVETVVLATGSCGTHAGLVAGLGEHERVLGVRVGERLNIEELVATKASEIAALAGRAVPSGACVMDHDRLGDGYGAVTQEALDAIELAARTEGLILDPVYTGKAMAGLIAARRSGRIARNTRTVFLHTGGLPGLFAERFQSCWDSP